MSDKRDEGHGGDGRKRHEHPIARNVHANDRIREGGYGFATACLSATQWTTSQRRMSALRLSSAGFNSDLSRRYMYLSGDGDGCLLRLVRGEKNMPPKIAADLQ